MKKIFLLVVYVILMTASAGATTFNYLYLDDYTPGTNGVIWLSDVTGFNTRNLLGVSTSYGGPLLSMGAPLSEGSVYYLYAGNLDVGTWTSGSPHQLLICTNGWASPGIQVLNFYVKGSPGTFELWTSDPQHAIWDTVPSSLPSPIPTIYLGWAQGTADLVGDLSQYYALPNGMAQPDGKNDVYLVLGIGVAPTNAPLPGAVWLLGSGLLGMGGWWRFRKG